jgi:polysaccharide export outer membrane protein
MDKELDMARKIFCVLLLLAFTGLAVSGAEGEKKEDVKKENSEPAKSGEYLVGIGDVLEIDVLQPEPIKLSVAVAPDGTISYPYIGTVRVKDKGLAAIQEEVQTALANGYMKYPVVSASLLESRSRKFFVYGEVNKPGTFVMEDGTTVLKAISEAGGFTKFGSSSNVKLLRPRKGGSGYEPKQIDIKGIMNGNPSSDITLEPGDIVVVSEGMF